ncbi:maleylpyruvate isomerase N-terminal domain-containing protein [Streptomyces olivaceoviridis]
MRNSLSSTGHGDGHPEWTSRSPRSRGAAGTSRGTDLAGGGGPRGGGGGPGTRPTSRCCTAVWWSASTRQSRDALREAGPDRCCWDAVSRSPQTCGAVARHRLYEIAPHTYDARITLGAPGPLPAPGALRRRHPGRPRPRHRRRLRPGHGP